MGRANAQNAVKSQCKYAYVDHSKGEFVRREVHTNTIDGWWGRLKTWWNARAGIQDDHIWTNLKEFQWRCNLRGPLCCRTFVMDISRTDLAVSPGRSIISGMSSISKSDRSHAYACGGLWWTAGQFGVEWGQI